MSTPATYHYQRRQNRALSLVELVIGFAVLSAAVLAGVGLLTAFIEGHTIDRDEHLGRELAEGLMAEITARGPGPSTGAESGARAQRRVVLEFNNWISPICTPQGDYYPVHPHVDPLNCSSDPTAGHILSPDLRGIRRRVHISQDAELTEITIYVERMDDDDVTKTLYTLVGYKDPVNNN